MTRGDAERAWLARRVEAVRLAIAAATAGPEPIPYAVADELARGFVGVAALHEPDEDPPLYDTAVAMMAHRYEHPGAGLGPQWYQHMPGPGQWHDLALAMTRAWSGRGPKGGKR